MAIKFTAERKKLLSLIIPALSASSNKSTLPALEGLLFNLKGDELSVCGYDLEKGIKTADTVSGESDGAVILNANKIASIIRNSETALIDIIKNSLSEIEKLFGNEKHMDELSDIVNKAIDLSKSDVDTLSAIEELGEGWVAEETIAIAVYCALKYENNFEKAICAAVNHSGDSDSTGAVCGNILGAYLGVDAIPQKYLEKLELKDLIEEITDDLYNGCKMDGYSDYQDEVWVSKYVKCDYQIKQKRGALFYFRKL